MSEPITQRDSYGNDLYIINDGGAWHGRTCRVIATVRREDRVYEHVVLVPPEAGINDTYVDARDLRRAR